MAWLRNLKPAEKYKTVYKQYWFLKCKTLTAQCSLSAEWMCRSCSALCTRCCVNTWECACLCWELISDCVDAREILSNTVIASRFHRQYIHWVTHCLFISSHCSVAVWKTWAFYLWVLPIRFIPSKSWMIKIMYLLQGHLSEVSSLKYPL